jgi:methylated-DNA-[protein]-cysteine S-methyltransferase
MPRRPVRYDAVLAAPFGALGIVARQTLTAIDFLPPRPEQRPGTELARKVAAQLRAYLKDPTFAFDLPLGPSGSRYQRRVWRALRRIPSGRTASYGELAKRLDSGARAVGGACRANPIPIVIPCHRVVARTGLGGFLGSTSAVRLDVKRWLLAHERAG